MMGPSAGRNEAAHSVAAMHKALRSIRITGGTAMTDDMTAEVRALRTDLARNIEATQRLADAIEGMTAILSQDMDDDADSAAGAAQVVAAYMDGTPHG